MTDLIKKELEEYRQEAMRFWHEMGEIGLEGDTRTESDERLLLGAIITAKEKMKYDTRVCKECKRRQGNDQK